MRWHRRLLREGARSSQGRGAGLLAGSRRAPRFVPQCPLLSGWVDRSPSPGRAVVSTGRRERVPERRGPGDPFCLALPLGWWAGRRPLAQGQAQPSGRTRTLSVWDAASLGRPGPASAPPWALVSPPENGGAGALKSLLGSWVSGFVRLARGLAPSSGYGEGAGIGVGLGSESRPLLCRPTRTPHPRVLRPGRPVRSLLQAHVNEASQRACGAGPWGALPRARRVRGRLTPLGG